MIMSFCMYICICNTNGKCFTFHLLCCLLLLLLCGSDMQAFCGMGKGALTHTTNIRQMVVRLG